MHTVTIQIGNSDDKLTQKQWSSFMQDVEEAIEDVDRDTFGKVEQHFSGCSHSIAWWQNACWVVAIEDVESIEKLKAALRRLARSYHQDSIAMTIGTTVFLAAGGS